MGNTRRHSFPDYHRPILAVGYLITIPIPRCQNSSRISLVCLNRLLWRIGGLSVRPGLFNHRTAAFCLFYLKQPLWHTGGLCGACPCCLYQAFFGHAHIAATEIPLTTFWFLAVLGILERINSSLRFILLGSMWGAPLPQNLPALYSRAPPGVEPFYIRNGGPVIIIALPLAPLLALLVNPGWWFQPLYENYKLCSDQPSRQERSPSGSPFFLGKAYSFSPALDLCMDHDSPLPSR